MPTKKPLGIPILALSALVPHLCAAAPGSFDEQAIVQLNNACLKAFDDGDVKTLDCIEADDFTTASDEGIRTKADQLATLRQRGVQAVKVDRQITDQKIRFYGDVAVMTEVDHASGPGGGKSNWQSTEVWARRAGSWRLVHLHYSKLAD
jgi:ketosteroid isomerase-like protein